MIVVIALFNSCNNILEEEELNIEKKETPSFSSVKEFNMTLDKVLEMSLQERIEWEKSHNYRSFGTIADSIYYSVDPDQFTSVDEIEAFVNKNSKYIELITDADGEISCVPKDENNVERYLMDDNLMYVIGSNVYRQIEHEFISSDINNISKIKLAEKINNLKPEEIEVVFKNPELQKVKSPDINKIKKGKKNAEERELSNEINYSGFKNQIVLWISTKAVFKDNITYTRHEYTVKNQKKTFIVWFNIGRPTSYYILFFTRDRNSNSEFEKCFYKVKDNEQISRENYYRDEAITSYKNTNHNPYFIRYNCWAKNSIGCKVEIESN